MTDEKLNKLLLSSKSPLKFNQKQRLKAEMRYEKAAEKNKHAKEESKHSH
jgi:hypothetical protein